MCTDQANRIDESIPAPPFVLPKINILFMPKSGTAYTSKTLSAGLSAPIVDSGVGVFPDRIIHPPAGWDMLLAGNFIHCSDLSLNDFHRFIFERTLTKTVLHIRDPRPALLSWVHYLDDRTQPRAALHTGNLRGTDHYLAYEDVIYERYMTQDWGSLSLEQKIDLNIDTFYVECLQWLSKWLDGVGKFRNVEFLITQHQELKDNEVAFFNKILDFYEIPRELFSHPHLAKSMAGVNYRKGSNVEWLEVFTTKQRLRVNEMLPTELMRRFGWG
jgi:hypothetical protein